MPITDVRKKLGRLLEKERSKRASDERKPSSKVEEVFESSAMGGRSRQHTSSSTLPVESSPDTFDETK